MKTNLFTAVLGLGLFGVMLSSSTENGEATTANQAPPMPGLLAPSPTATNPTSIPFTVYLSLVTAFTNGQSIDFNEVGNESQLFIWNEKPKWGMEQ